MTELFTNPFQPGDKVIEKRPDHRGKAAVGTVLAIEGPICTVNYFAMGVHQTGAFALRIDDDPANDRFRVSAD